MQPQDFGIGQLFWSVHEAVVVADVHTGQIVLWNPAAEALFGYSAAEAVGQLVEIVIPARLRAPHRAGLVRYRATGHGAAIDARLGLELPAVRKTGEEIPIELVLGAIARTDGADATDGRFVLALIRDLTERRRAEGERLRRSVVEAARATAEAAEQRLTFLSEASEQLASTLDYEVTLRRVARLAVPTLADVCIVDAIGEDGAIHRLAVAHVDPARERLVFGLRHRYPPDSNGPHQVARVLRTGRPEIMAEMSDVYLEAVAQDAEHLRILRTLNYRSAIAVPLAAGGRTLGVLSLLMADSDRRYGPADLALAENLANRCAMAIDNARLYHEAQEAIRARDDFLSLAAHELKTPITSLRGFAQVMIRRLDRGRETDPAALRRALLAMEQQTGRLAYLVSDLLDASLVDRGRLRLERRTVDLAQLTRDVVAAARARGTDHQTQVRTPPELLASLDPIRIEQVLNNLLDNAIKYGMAGGIIDVELTQPSPRVAQVSVRDRGPGIPLEHQGRIFERFFQVPGVDRAGGLGLGLYVSRQIAELHGGKITVESPADGGTRFVITLPARSDDQSEDDGHPS